MLFRTAVGELWALLRRAVAIYGEVEAPQRAAAFAYYALFTIFPFLAMLLVLGSLFFPTDNIVAFINQISPLGASEREFVWDLVSNLEQARGGTSVLSVLIFLWGSIEFFQSLVRAVNRAWHTQALPWWQVPIKNLGMVIIISSALLLGLIVPPILQTLRDLAERFLPHLVTPAILVAFDLVRYVAGLCILIYSISTLYVLAPRQRPKASLVIVPAFVVALVVQVLQVSFVNYLPRILHYNVIYGTVGVLMFLLMWIYLSGLVIVAGACICAARGRTDPPIPSTRAD